MSDIISSLDNQIKKLISEVSSAKDITTNTLLKSRVSLQLTKIEFGLKLIGRVKKLFDLQGEIEDRLLNEDSIKDLSIRELLVMSSVNSKRIDNYFGKMDKILSSLNLRELENSLLMIAELDSKSVRDSNALTDESSKNLTDLSLKLLKTITILQNQSINSQSDDEDTLTARDLTEDLNKRPFDLSLNPDSEYVILDEDNDELQANRVLSNIESITDPEFEDYEDDDDETIQL